MLRIKQRGILFVPAVAACAFLMVTLGLYFSNINDAFAEDMFVYPQKGQSDEQIEKDKFACYTWAKNQTGFDPMEVPRTTALPPQKEAPKGILYTMKTAIL